MGENGHYCENGHYWKKRGSNICPFKCSECGALSGTDKALNKCLGEDKSKSVVIDRSDILSSMEKTTVYDFLDFS